jgi:uncharacterized protein DUF4291
VRVQWDPERSIALERLEHRAIQVGLGRDAVDRYVDEWIQGIEDVTPLAHEIQSLVQRGGRRRGRPLGGRRRGDRARAVGRPPADPLAGHAVGAPAHGPAPGAARSRMGSRRRFFLPL